MKKLLAMLLAAAMTIGTASVALAEDMVAEYNGTKYLHCLRLSKRLLIRPTKPEQSPFWIMPPEAVLQFITQVAYRRM